MGLSVPHAWLSIPPVGQRVHQIAHVPVLIVPCLQRLNPLVCNSHLQAVVKAHASLLPWTAQSGHARNVLTDGDAVGEDIVQQVVHQHEVHHRIHISVQAKVLVVVAGEGVLEAMMVVHHAGHAIEAVAVKLVLIDPPARVAEQEAHGLPVAVVEQTGVPHPVVPACTSMEVHAVCAVEHVDAIHGILGGMAVDNVHEHHHAEPVGFINEGLQVVRGAKPGGRAKEVGNMVAERAVVCMLLDGHDLDSVVARLADARQHVTPEFQVAVDLGLCTAHAHVALVDAQGTGLGWARVLEGVAVVRADLSRPALALGGLVIHTIEGNGTRVLGGPLDPSGDLVMPLAVSCLQPALDLALVGDGAGAIGQVRNEQLPSAKRVLHCPVLIAGCPVVELSNQGKSLCTRRPLAVPDTRLAFVSSHTHTSVEAHQLVALRELG
mmetsp:Transcript_10693/g.29307  ORF Transcript_10693/g.29307 Transcript_10693/m.29307 type:complete len:435 (+) Transcript_10693:1707-3011(+)